jgi:hypothetical protein
VNFADSVCAAREHCHVRWIEIIERGDPRAALFDDAKRKELYSLIDCGTFTVVLESQALKDADGPLTIVPGKDVLTIKRADSSKNLKA